MQNNNRLRIFYQTFIIVLLCSATTVVAQEKNKNLFLIARSTKDSIMLRWAPNNYETWQMGNNYGYKLIRYTVIRDSALLPKAIKTDLSFSGIRVMEFNKWETLVKNNKYAAIAAQAIFGESFEVNVGENITPESVVNLEKEQNHRFSFALYAADASPDVAKISGLWFTDRTAKKDEMYLYRVFINFPDSVNLKNDTAFVFTGIRDYFPLPVPVEISAEFNDKIVSIKWNSFAQDNIYTSWQIYKSADNKHFKEISTNSIVPLNQYQQEISEYSYKLDSLTENNKTYYYKIRGITPFGEYGPWSKTVSGQGKGKIYTTPNISKHSVENNKVNISWIFNSESEKNIDGFRILRSYNDRVGFKEIYTVKAKKRSFTDKKPLGTNYYKVVAYKNSGSENESLPYLVQLEDNKAPHKPKGLSGKVDSLYIAHIKWNKNEDDDILGYKLFRSMSGNDEFSLISKNTITDTCYVDTLSKNNLNKTVFYKLMAIDLRQNQSEMSDIAKLMQPDKIPPLIPVISNIETLIGGLKITWINSSSKDTEKYEVYRQTGNDMLKIKIAEIPHQKGKKESFYIDNKCSDETYNSYIIRAYDANGNSSESSKSISIKPLKDKRSTALKKINYKTENSKIYINWQLPKKRIRYIKIYKKVNQESYVLFDTLDGKVTSFEDDNVKNGNTYHYSIKLIYDDNSISPFSKEINVEL